MPILFPGAFPTPDTDSYVAQETTKRPVLFDILGPDMETSILPNDLKLVLHVNPRSMTITYQKVITRIQTRGGWVEQHFGDGTQSITFDFSTGGFMRLFSGLSNITGGGAYNAGGSRRQTIAYDKFVDLLALFENNGQVEDVFGRVVLHGIIKVVFDGTVWFGWFQSFTVTEASEQPYQFTLNAQFVVSHEIMGLKTVIDNTAALLNRDSGSGGLGFNLAAEPLTVDENLNPLPAADPNGEVPDGAAQGGAPLPVGTDGAEDTAVDFDFTQEPEG